MATTTKDFNGTDNDSLNTYDSNFISIRSAGSGAEIFNPAGEEECRVVTTYDLQIFYYDQSEVGSDQISTIYAKIGEDGSLIENISPTVMTETGIIGYFLELESDGTDVTNCNLRRSIGTTGGTWLVGVGSGTLANAVTSTEYTLSAVINGSGDVELSVIIGSTDYGLVFTDTDPAKHTTGQPGFDIYAAADITTNSLQSFTATAGASSGLAYVDTGLAIDSNSVTTFTLTYGFSPVEGNILIAFVTVNMTAAEVINTPSGWTLIHGSADNVASSYSAAFWREAGAAEPTSQDFTYTGSGSKWIGNVYEFSGQDTSAPINDESLSAPAGSATPASPTITTDIDGCFILSSIGWNNLETGTPLDTLKNTWTDVTSAGSSIGNMGGWKGQLVLGATGAYTHAVTGVPTYVGSTIAIAPASSGTDYPLTATTDSYAVSGTDTTFNFITGGVSLEYTKYA